MVPTALQEIRALALSMRRKKAVPITRPLVTSRLGRPPVGLASENVPAGSVPMQAEAISEPMAERPRWAELEEDAEDHQLEACEVSEQKQIDRAEIDAEEHKLADQSPVTSTTAEDTSGEAISQLDSQQLQVSSVNQRQEEQIIPTIEISDSNRAAAKLVFAGVIGILNGTYSQLPSECEAAVTVLLSGVPSYLQTSFNALAAANQAGLVPLPALATLILSMQPVLGTLEQPLLLRAVAGRLDRLAVQLKTGVVPASQWDGLMKLHAALSKCKDLPQAAKVFEMISSLLCPSCGKSPPEDSSCKQCSGSGYRPCVRCSGTGKYSQPCRTCGGQGRQGTRCCQRCDGKRMIVLGECRSCAGGAQNHIPCFSCKEGRPLCKDCCTAKAEQEKQHETTQTPAQRNTVRSVPRSITKSAARDMFETGPPSEGVTVTTASQSDLAWLQKLWEERCGRNTLVQAWHIDNPLLSWKFKERRLSMEKNWGRAPDELYGFHGSAPCNFLSIMQQGFRSDLRSGQVYGSGEYFAKDPNVSMGYCHGGSFMLVCRLLLGEESYSRSNRDGDHIWVPDCQYYVISHPAQAQPLFLIQFKTPGTSDPLLDQVLRAGSWSTKKEESIIPVPPNRPCVMSRSEALVLWIGFLHAHHSDAQLEDDVRGFFDRHAPAYVDGLKIQIVRGTFKKAHAILARSMPRNLVHQLNSLPFQEGGIERTVCVEDAHGSPEQKCPKFIAKYCRGQNLRYTMPCWCWHPRRETETARYEREQISLFSAKGNEIMDKFMSSAPFHDGYPTIIEIHAIRNPVLSRLHEQYRSYLQTKHREEPSVRELYHGTNNNIHDVVFTHGLQPPSDCQASDACPVSGGKGLSTTLCTNSCKYCTEKHEWDRCHMFGLGIYLADLAQKSHRYVSRPETKAGRRRYRMIVCSVLGKAFKLEGHLNFAEAMHDVANIRALSAEELQDMVTPCTDLAASSRGGRAATERAGADATSDTLPEKSDLLFVQGLGGCCRPGFSVFNSEYIAYHPHQCLPKYEITYEM